MASSPSATYERLRDYIAERMHMSPIDQPLMLLELLGRRSPAPAQDLARRILGNAHGGQGAHRQWHHRLRQRRLQPDRRR
ncbi:hypothetical protein [Cyanobium sp. NS01]|uniref:hypothetical protein n=1 Tax=Cyanobium sp. NS01 TaxID=261284 RepID=UPI001CEC0A7B